MCLPTLATMALAMKRAISAVLNAAKRHLEVLFLGSSLSVSVNTSASVNVSDGDDHSPPQHWSTHAYSRAITSGHESYVSIPLADPVDATTTETVTTTTTTITLTTLTSSTLFTFNGVRATIVFTTAAPISSTWTVEDTGDVAAVVATLCARNADASVVATSVLPAIRSLLSQVQWPSSVAASARRSLADRFAALTIASDVGSESVAARRRRHPRVGVANFTPEQDETQGELVVFGPPRIFQSAGEYDLRLSDASARLSDISEPMSPTRIARRERWESFLMRPNIALSSNLERMSPNPELSPQDPVDPATHFCSCGMCPNGIAATQQCNFLTNFRREQRFRRRATTSPAIGAINRWHSACSTRQAFGCVRC